MAAQSETNRKVHLDFHIPHWVKEVAKEYDPELYCWRVRGVLIYCDDTRGLIVG